MRAVIRTIVVLLLVLLGGFSGLFMVKNGHWIELNLPIIEWNPEKPISVLQYETRVWFLLLVSFMGGVVLTLGAVLPMWIRFILERRRERQLYAGIEEELIDLRNLPISSALPYGDFDLEQPLSDSENSRDLASKNHLGVMETSDTDGSDEDEELQQICMSPNRPA